MAILFTTVLAEARGLLNDVSGAIYPDAPMVVLGNKVYRELQTKLSALGMSTSKEVSAAIDIPAGTVRIGDGALLPADLLYPLYLEERQDGSTSEEDYVPMTETEWEPSLVQTDSLRYWTWREDEIKFPGALVIREVRIRYVKSLGSITATNSPIAILNSETWFAQRLAVVASLVIGSNPTRAQALNEDLRDIWGDFQSTLVKGRQRIPVRRRRTRYRAP